MQKARANQVSPEGAPALARTYAPGAGAGRRTLADQIGVLFVSALVLLGVGLTGAFLSDRVSREMARPHAAESWRRARQVLTVRLHQEDPLEFGAVWATHSGLICGLVNGRHSFSGLAGMTPFAVDGPRAAFALDQTALAFAPYWRECMTDQWIRLLDGSMQAGGCATRLGQARCVTVAG